MIKRWTLLDRADRRMRSLTRPGPTVWRGAQALAVVCFACQAGAVWSNPIGQDLFADRFTTGIVGVVTDQALRYNRRDGRIVVPTECARSYSMAPIATPTGPPWSFAYQPVLATMTLQAQGFTYRRPCTQAAGTTQLIASNPPLSDAVELVFVQVPQITTVEGPPTYPVTDSVITVPLQCAIPFNGQLMVNEPGTFTFTYTDPPPGFLADGSGSFTYTPVCGENTSLQAQARSATGTTPPVQVAFELTNPPTLSGVDLDSDGGADLVNSGGSLPDFVWLRDFPVTLGLVGDASSYSSSLGSVSGSDWSLNESVGGLYTLTAHRDGLEDSASGSLLLRNPVLERLGSHDFVSGSTSFSIPCGSEFVAELVTNTDDLLPSVSDTYSSSDLPVGASVVGDVFSYTPSCAQGSPENVSFGLTPTISSGGNNLTLDEYLVDVSITGVSQGPTFDIEGLDFECDGTLSQTPYHNNWFDANDDGVIDQPWAVYEDKSAPAPACVMTDTSSITLSERAGYTLPEYAELVGNRIEMKPGDETAGQTGTLELLVTDTATGGTRPLDVPYEVVPKEPVIVGLAYSQQNGTIDNPVDGSRFEYDIEIPCTVDNDERFIVTEHYDPDMQYQIINNPPGKVSIDQSTGAIVSNYDCGTDIGWEFDVSVRAQNTSAASLYKTGTIRVTNGVGQQSLPSEKPDYR